MIIGGNLTLARSSKSSKKTASKEDTASDTPSPDTDLEVANQEDSSESSESIEDTDAQNIEESIADAVVIEDDATEKAGALEVPEDEQIKAEAEAEVDVRKSEPTPMAASTEAGPSTFGLIFGGLIAGAIGFLVATFAVPEGWPNPPQDTDAELRELVDRQQIEIQNLTDALAAIEAMPSQPADVVLPDPVDLTPVTDSVAAIEGRIEQTSDLLSGLASTVEGIEQRLASLESRPEVTIADGSAAMEAQLESFRSELDMVTDSARAEIEEAQARAAEIEAAAAATAEAATRRAALADLTAALESGASFADSLAALGDAPADLASVADDGVATLASLQSDFPALARRALGIAQTVPEDAGTTNKITAFLRRQTNARSLSPREGDDSDAILSRAEAALSEGDLTNSIAELETLPDDAQNVLAGWLETAKTRQAALDAAQSLQTEN